MGGPLEGSKPMLKAIALLSLPVLLLAHSEQLNDALQRIHQLEKRLGECEARCGAQNSTSATFARESAMMAGRRMAANISDNVALNFAGGSVVEVSPYFIGLLIAGV